MLRVRMVLVALSFLCAAAAAQSENGLVAHWDFNEGKGDVLHDRSGNANHGKIQGAKWVKCGKGHALRFDGVDDCVDCGAGPTLDIRDHVSMVLWVWPDRRLKGGEPAFVGKAFKSYVTTQFYGKAYTYISGNAGGGNLELPLTMRTWQHIASTYDGEHLRFYLNGRLATERPMNVKINGGGHFWMGRSDGSVKYTRDAHFNGMITEVKVYNRALTQAEVLEHVRSTARAKGLSVPTKVGIRIQPYPELGKIRATLDARALRPLPEGAVLRADLCRAGARKPIIRLDTTGAHEVGIAELLFDARKLPAGNYVIRAGVIGPDDARIGEESSASLEWRGQPAEFKNVRVLNNLCWELLNLSGESLSKSGDKQVFANPWDRWVFIQTTAALKNGGKLWLSLDSASVDKAVIVHTKGGESELEAMRFLPAGRYTVYVGREGNAELRHIVIRAIPMLQYAFYNNPPCIRPFGPYDWKFLSKDVLPNVNVMVSYVRRKQEPAHLKEWTKMGRSWIMITDNARALGKGATVEGVYKYWSDAMGFQHPLMDGLIVDEFGGGDAPIYDVYRKAVERIYANPKFKGKAFMPYGGTFYGADRSREFARVCAAGGGYIAWERYLREPPTEDEARAVIQRSITDRMFQWEEALPGCTRRMIMVLGLMSQPNESLNVDPTVDFRAFMDMQIGELATHPAFFGLAGIQEYFTYIADEETLRLTGRLYRHYCIQGNTEPLIKDPYKLTHIRNPDFADPFGGWTVSPAEPGSIKIKEHAGYSWLQGRYPRTSMGDTFLWTKRSANKPNVFSQEIKDLTPGRLYSMKMITGDYRDLVAEKSDWKMHEGVSIKLENVDMLLGPKKSFQTGFVNWGGAHDLGKFNTKHRYCMNYHWRVFRAKGSTAKLSVSDWKSDPSTSSGQAEPGGPIGQELMFNFIEIQPYIGD